ncbi:LOW QUALITY PROTEIN: Pol protein [Phytophthora palmivora]|uniref:Pol protein n=1 Tax=Phytophthora palmivora TaxID=4796 RepID=A0A2P4Y1S3_9STRA|nr:LOW QUALITY PROTEIN: Pol protein [Phytophthora palmivora]
MVRESKSPHSMPTFCVRKPNGNWRLVHAYNKLNNATVPAQTPIPRKDVLLELFAIQRTGSTTANRLVTHLLRSLGDFAQTYFDDVFIRRRAIKRLNGYEGSFETFTVSKVMMAGGIHVNVAKRIFVSEEIKYFCL